MAFNGSGLFVRLYNWVTDAAAGIKILAARMDAEMDGMATGLSTCLTKDGQTTVSANLPMNNFRHTGAGNAAARTDYAVTGQVQDSAFTYAAGGGAANVYTLTLAPSIAVYVAGQRFVFKVPVTNTGASTLNVDALGAKSILKAVSTALSGGELVLNDIVSVVYDGTNFQLDPTNHIDLASNTLTGTTAQFNTALSDNDFATLAGAETLTNKTVNLTSNTLTGTLTQFNTALSDADFAVLTAVQAWTQQQYFGTATLTDAANISWNLDTQQVATVTLGGNRTLDNPTNLKNGAAYRLTIKQDATGGRTLTFGTAYKFAGGVDPAITTAASAVDVLSCASDGTSMFCTILQDVK